MRDKGFFLLVMVVGSIMAFSLKKKEEKPFMIFPNPILILLLTMFGHGPMLNIRKILKSGDKKKN